MALPSPVILILIVVLPFIVLVYVSFITYVHVPSAKTWELLTLDNYRSNLTDSRTFRALQNSLVLAVGGATLCMLLASVTAWSYDQDQDRGQGVIEALTLSLGLSGLPRHRSLWTYVYMPLPIYGTCGFY
jgi:iron(III) transport system permease protein